uniref:Uncharacterized protein n=1 Tax=Arundo donax TaxID=35708 RepID=A0A0A9CFH5_ARUDO
MKCLSSSSRKMSLQLKWGIYLSMQFLVQMMESLLESELWSRTRLC